MTAATPVTTTLTAAPSAIWCSRRSTRTSNTSCRRMRVGHSPLVEVAPPCHVSLRSPERRSPGRSSMLLRSHAQVARLIEFSRDFSENRAGSAAIHSAWDSFEITLPSICPVRLDFRGTFAQIPLLQCPVLRRN